MTKRTSRRIATRTSRRSPLKSNGRTSRMRANTIPPAPTASGDWRQWFMKTYAPGTRVKTRGSVSFWSQNLRGGNARERTFDTRGVVVQTWPDMWAVVVEETVPLFTSSTTKKWYYPIRLDTIGELRRAADNFEPLDDNWGPLVTPPISRHSLPFSQKRTSRKLRPNAIPPVPTGDDDFGQWARTTFAPGTRVRSTVPLRGSVESDGTMRAIPAGSVGRVVLAVYPGSRFETAELIVEFTIRHELFTSSTDEKVVVRRAWHSVVGDYGARDLRGDDDDERRQPELVPLDDNWGPLTIAGPSRATPGQTSGWQRQLSTSRKYRAMKPNAVERPRENSAMLLSWVERTYAPGTPVKLLQPWRMRHNQEIPAGARGEVKWAGLYAGMPSVIMKISDARDSSGQRLTHVIGEELLIEDDHYRSIAIEDALAPLVDNWATPAGPSKHYSRGQTQGWQKQLRASRKYRSMKPNILPKWGSESSSWGHGRDEKKPDRVSSPTKGQGLVASALAALDDFIVRARAALGDRWWSTSEATAILGDEAGPRVKQWISSRERKGLERRWDESGNNRRGQWLYRITA